MEGPLLLILFFCLPVLLLIPALILGGGGNERGSRFLAWIVLWTSCPFSLLVLGSGTVEVLQAGTMKDGILLLLGVCFVSAIAGLPAFFAWLILQSKEKGKPFRVGDLVRRRPPRDGPPGAPPAAVQ